MDRKSLSPYWWAWSRSFLLQAQPLEYSIHWIVYAQAKRLRLILGRLNAATDPKDMDLPDLRLHKLSGNRDGFWSVKVSGNWRVTFLFENGDAEIEDYH
ncbi:type II toxin-antitoxin system RelE/ParE family toxin [Desulfonatronovibrio magnus]|uniref:type II toxin-antitoxin system RelE/ParE family toxin n=1 Tax=Desulfonatronovibrio magnus TaxID=698827 RepID=UPI0022B6E54B|nr:type II toxin-antitoxin system RelE/ParE family toxin [Desulfonatronovibrio magnus]